jgi:hypothetical protein
MIRKYGASNLTHFLGRDVVVMKTASEYRAMAEECFRWAREANRVEVRESYIQLAQVWLTAASLLDGGPPTRIASPETHPKRHSEMTA